jgi:hypothetical protein
VIVWKKIKDWWNAPPLHLKADGTSIQMWEQESRLKKLLKVSAAHLHKNWQFWIGTALTVAGLFIMAIAFGLLSDDIFEVIVVPPCLFAFGFDADI